MASELTKRDRLLFGVALPIGIMIVGLLLVMQTDTGAAAAEFAALGIFLGGMIATPVVVIVNLIVALQGTDTLGQVFRRGMIAPGFILLAAVVYQTGLWDRLT